MTRRRWIAGSLLLALVLLLAVAIQIPAGVAQKLLAGQDQPIHLIGASGTLWQGAARQVRVGQWQFGPVAWRLSLAQLLLLRVNLHVDVSGPPLQAQLELTRFVNGAMALRVEQAELPALWLQHIVDQPGMTLAGQIQAHVDNAVVDADGWLVELQGEARWVDAQVSGAGVSGGATDLGDLVVTWQTVTSPQPDAAESRRIEGTLNDSGGPLALSGQVNFANRSWRVRAALGARNGDVAIRQALSYLGPADANGQVRLEIFGPLIAL